MSPTMNARVWDAYNQERPEEPNADASSWMSNDAMNAEHTAQGVVKAIWSRVYADDPVDEFDVIVEMPNGSRWNVTVSVQHEPVLYTGGTKRFEPGQ